MNKLNAISLLMASISLILSFITIYFTFLRPAKLKTFVGPFMIISRHKDNFAFSIATTIANHSNQTGVIKRCTLVVTHNDTPQQNYHMLWSFFRKLNTDGSTWIQGDTVSSIAVIAKSTENKNIVFLWRFENKPVFQFKEGTYQLKFHFWSHRSKPIIHLEHEVYINAAQANQLNNPNIVDKTIQISMDNDLNENELLTSKQVDKLKRK